MAEIDHAESCSLHAEVSRFHHAKSGTFREGFGQDRIRLPEARLSALLIKDTVTGLLANSAQDIKLGPCG
jgi:hypothetical protein